MLERANARVTLASLGRCGAQKQTTDDHQSQSKALAHADLKIQKSLVVRATLYRLSLRLGCAVCATCVSLSL